jgi:hypothetical protein
MRKARSKTSRVLKVGIKVEQLPALVPRSLAADFALLTERTLLRAERKGLLSPIKRNLRTVSYRKEELLKFLGIEEEISA